MSRGFSEQRSLLGRFFLALALGMNLGITASCLADDKTSPPVEGLLDKRPGLIAITASKVVTSPGMIIDSGTVIIRDGIIESVGTNLNIPPDAKRHAYPQGTIYAGLVESYSERAVEGTREGAAYWNRGVSPELSVLQGLTVEKDTNAAFRKAGFTARLLAPSRGHIRGRSALINTGDGSVSTAVVRPEVAMHANLSLRFSFDRSPSYPGSPMGALTLVRQALLDAEWYREAWRIASANPSLEQPEVNDGLAALAAAREASLLWIFDATANERYFLRSDQVAREFGLPAIILGSGREYRRLTDVLATKRAIILPVRFPRAPYVATAEAATRASLEHLLHWDLAPNNPGQLVNGGATVALSTFGLEKTTDFWSAVRQAMRRGLPPEAALASLTTIPAQLLGADKWIGTIAPGKKANLTVSDGDLFSINPNDEPRILATWIEGKCYPQGGQDRQDLRGKWSFEMTTLQGNRWSIPLSLKGSGDNLTGTLEINQKPVELANIRQSDMFMSFQFVGDGLGQNGICRATLRLVPGVDRVVMEGQGIFPSGEEFTCRGTRLATKEDEESEAPETSPSSGSTADSVAEASPDTSASRPGDNESSEKSQTPPTALFTTTFPLSAYGLESPPPQPEKILFKNATVWTSGPVGKLENASVLVQKGIIQQVGPAIEAPDAFVIDCKGKHITPGIIDCHSHIATDGGVNEATQAITAEVRIGDFIDSDDISIYRQLAGGVTSSNILHGSANPIGGQNQVIKMRWGSSPEEMKFREAPPGIKFALGENVKQSNWGDEFRSRYPQTRMGVDEIIEDAFLRASDYAARKKDWEANHRGLPPRKDLELEAISQILAGERWIHCHSYRQSEIMALMLLCDRYQVRIGTFQHILEGYKVADEMAKRGIMGSAFSDWWAYKFEVFDAIPYAGALMHNAGVVVSYNSDDAEMGRRLNLEAAKAMRYGEVSAEEAFKFVTLNPARQLRIDSFVGSLEPGKHADVVVWSGNPLSVYSRCEQTWVDGRRYFSIDQSRELETRDRARHAALVQRVLSLKAEQLAEGEAEPSLVDLWPRSDTYCHGHEHEHDDARHHD